MTSLATEGTFKDGYSRFGSLRSSHASNSEHGRYRPTWRANPIVEDNSTASSLSRFPSLHSRRNKTISTATSILTSRPGVSDFTYGDGSQYMLPILHDTSDANLYTELPLLTIDSVRLLRIRPGPPESPLFCELFITNLLEYEDQYFALSHTWGSDNSTWPIYINQRLIEVRRNLIDFIHALRDTRHDVIVWADAICIDQKSPVERNHQVQLMSSIYSKAACTRSWLGNDFPALAGLMKLAAEEQNVDVRRIVRQSGLNSEVLLDVLLDHRYWTRTWIVQEVILAKEVWMHCGDQEVDWIRFVEMTKGLANASGSINLRGARAYGASNLMHLHRMRNSKRPRGLPDLLTEYANTNCQDHRDRVFGLIGLISDPKDPLYCEDPLFMTDEVSRKRKAIIDYSKSSRNLFMQLTIVYPTLATYCFALPLWKLFELDYCTFNAKELCQRVQVQIFPCAMLTFPNAHIRPLASVPHRAQSSQSFREELFCFSDPQTRTNSRHSRVCIAIRLNVCDFQANGCYVASACWIESEDLKIGHIDSLCQAFENTLIYKLPEHDGNDQKWGAHLPLAALKALHAITNPGESQRILDAMEENIFSQDDLDPDLQIWCDAMKELSVASIKEYERTTTPANQKNAKQNELPQPVSRKKFRHKMVKAIGLTSIYDKVVQPLYRDRLPAWE